MTIPKGLSAIEVAQLHYDLLKKSRDEWAETIQKQDREQLKRVRGTSAEFWYKTGRKRVEAGIKYVFDHVDTEEENYVKLFFKRIDKNGNQQGMPVPIHLVKEDGEWRVRMASY